MSRRTLLSPTRCSRNFTSQPWSMASIQYLRLVRFIKRHLVHPYAPHITDGSERTDTLLLMVIHPYLTKDFGRKTGSMVREEYWGALGSHQLLLDYALAIKRWLGSGRQPFNAYGCNDFDPPRRLPGTSPDPKEELVTFHVDERAFLEYGGLLAIARRSGVRIVGIITPIDPVYWQALQHEYEDYFRRIRPLFLDGEPVIDLNSSDCLSLSSTRDNFSDGVHLSRKAAAEVISALERRIKLLDPPLPPRRRP
jgi:hypothetical protein